MRIFLSYLSLFILVGCADNNEEPDPVNPTKQAPEADLVEIPVTGAPFLTEVSGMAHSLQTDSILFVHNDSGGEPEIYAISKSGRYLGAIRLSNGTNQDWEAIATVENNGKRYVYIADFGDNKSQYTSYFFYRFEEPIPSQYLGNTLEITAEVAEYTYEDIITQDAEAFLVDQSSLEITILSKVLSNSRVYDLGNPFTGSNLATRTGTIDYGFVTAADNNANQVLVKTYGAVYCFEQKSDFFETLQTEPAILTYTPEYRGESICWDRNNQGYFTMSELSDTDEFPVLNHYTFR